MTTAQIQIEIAEITTALSHIRKAGQSYTIMSGNTQRTVTLADYDKLKKERQELYNLLDSRNGGRGIVFRAGW